MPPEQRRIFLNTYAATCQTVQRRDPFLTDAYMDRLRSDRRYLGDVATADSMVLVQEKAKQTAHERSAHLRSERDRLRKQANELDSAARKLDEFDLTQLVPAKLTDESAWACMTKRARFEYEASKILNLMGTLPSLTQEADAGTVTVI